MTEFYAGIQDSWAFTPTHEEIRLGGNNRRRGKAERERLLIDAAAEGRGWLVEYLLVSAEKESVDPVDINAKSETGQTALMAAAAKGHHKVVDLLIRHAASVNTISEYGETAATLAAEGGHLEALKVLERAGADFTVRIHHTGETLAARAKALGHESAAQYLAAKAGGAIVSKNNAGLRTAETLRLSAG